MADVKLTEAAEADLQEIWDYISEKNIDAANRVIGDLMGKFRFLAKNSKIGKPQDKIILNLRKFSHKKYIIFYFEIENGVEIYRIFHGARNIETLFEDFFEGLQP